jgi:5,5'-dehydrodivanillate O-demethylase
MPQDTLNQLTSAQDYVAAVGQGEIVDRANEHLGKSDMGIAFLRRIYWRELEAMRQGRSIKEWRRLAHSVDLPKQVREPTSA